MCEDSLLLVFAAESMVYTQRSNFIRELGRKTSYFFKLTVYAFHRTCKQ